MAGPLGTALNLVRWLSELHTKTGLLNWWRSPCHNHLVPSPRTSCAPPGAPLGAPHLVLKILFSIFGTRSFGKLSIHIKDISWAFNLPTIKIQVKKKLCGPCILLRNFSFSFQFFFVFHSIKWFVEVKSILHSVTYLQNVKVFK